MQYFFFNTVSFSLFSDFQLVHLHFSCWLLHREAAGTGHGCYYFKMSCRTCVIGVQHASTCKVPRIIGTGENILFWFVLSVGANIWSLQKLCDPLQQSMISPNQYSSHNLLILTATLAQIREIRALTNIFFFRFSSTWSTRQRTKV